MIIGMYVHHRREGKETIFVPSQRDCGYNRRQMQGQKPKLSERNPTTNSACNPSSFAFGQHPARNTVYRKFILFLGLNREVREMQAEGNKLNKNQIVIISFPRIGFLPQARTFIWFGRRGGFEGQAK